MNMAATSGPTTKPFKPMISIPPSVEINTGLPDILYQRE